MTKAILYVIMSNYHPSIQSSLSVPSICWLLCSVVTAVRRGWVSHSFPRPVIAGKGCTLSFSRRAIAAVHTHGVTRAGGLKDLSPTIIPPLLSSLTLPGNWSDITLLAVYDYPSVPQFAFLSLCIQMVMKTRSHCYFPL